MLRDALGFLFGFTEVRIPKENGAILDLLLKYGISYQRKQTKKGVSLRFFRRERKKLADLLDKSDIGVYSIYDRGIPSILYRYRYRVGIIVGCFLFFFGIWFSNRFIWDIRISGNTTLSDSYILSCLDGLGCRVGAYCPSLDFYELTTAYLENYDDVCWISVNMKGNIAYVELTESQPKPKSQQDSPSNLVAKRGGIVTAVYLYGGDSLIKVGDSVEAGQVLVSGFTVDRYEQIRLAHADAVVMAKTARTLTVQIPLEDSRTVNDGDVQKYTTAELFGITVPLYFGQLPTVEATVTQTESYLTLFGFIRTPIRLSTEAYTPTRQESFSRSEAEAKSQALACMNREIAERLSDCRILDVKKYAFFTDARLDDASVSDSDGTENQTGDGQASTQGATEYYTLRYEFVCEENIAEQKPISLGNTGGSQRS